MIIAVANNKGGVGKTTTAINLAATLATPRRRVLLVDLDSQASASMWLGARGADARSTAASSFLHHQPLQRAVRPTSVKYLDVVAGSVELANADVALSHVSGRESILKRTLQSVRHDYPLIVLDCPPGLSLVAVNALVAADGVIVPVPPQHLALGGLGNLLAAVDKVRGRMAARARVLGILLTRVSTSRSGPAELSDRLRAQYRDLVFHTEICESPALEDAPGAGRTVLDLPARSRAADAFRRLAGEVLERIRPLGR